MRRVCLTGAESTGKSTLAPRLAAMFGGVVVPEYGRIYAETLGTAFGRDDLRSIATDHIAVREDIEATAPRLIVEDTDIVMTAAWAEMLFGARDPVLAAIPATADLYLLFDAGVPWIDDGTRMFGEPRERTRFDALIGNELRRRRLVPVRIGGDWAAREAAAVVAVRQRFPELG